VNGDLRPFAAKYSDHRRSETITFLQRAVQNCRWPYMAKLRRSSPNRTFVHRAAFLRQMTALRDETDIRHKCANSDFGRMGRAKTVVFVLPHKTQVKSKR